jgi:hypothetical protein
MQLQEVFFHVVRIGSCRQSAHHQDNVRAIMEHDMIGCCELVVAQAVSSPSPDWKEKATWLKNIMEVVTLRSTPLPNRIVELGPDRVWWAVQTFPDVKDQVSFLGQVLRCCGSWPWRETRALLSTILERAPYDWVKEHPFTLAAASSYCAETHHAQRLLIYLASAIEHISITLLCTVAKWGNELVMRTLLAQPSCPRPLPEKVLETAILSSCNMGFIRWLHAEVYAPPVAHWLTRAADEGASEELLEFLLRDGCQ